MTATGQAGIGRNVPACTFVQLCDATMLHQGSTARTIKNPRLKTRIQCIWITLFNRIFVFVLFEQLALLIIQV